MIRLAANIGMLFTELPFIDRFAAAADAGFGGVEVPFTDALAPMEISRRLRSTGLVQVLGTLPATSQDKGLAAVAGGEHAFAQRLQTGLDAAVEAECPFVHVTTGVVPDEAMAAASEVFMSNMIKAVREAERRNIVLVVEAINQRDLPGYFIRSQRDAMDWVARIGHPSLRLLVDFYHGHLEGVSLSASLAALATHGAHAQIAGAPGRAEPGTGDLDCADLFCRLDAQGYAGWLGCEYVPTTSTTAGLAWRNGLPIAAVSHSLTSNHEAH